jgi:hypothetical protein
MKALLVVLLWIPAARSQAFGLNIIDYAPPGTPVDLSGRADASQALINVMQAANELTAKGRPACVYLPAGVYRISRNPPPFKLAGCVKGDGPSQTIIRLDPSFAGDLFSWSEAWEPTTPGPAVVGMQIIGDRDAQPLQNALVFYDRNDEVFLDCVVVRNLHGRALYSGATKNTTQAYMRESQMRSLRFFNDGAPGVPTVEFTSQGVGAKVATNEIRISQLDIYGSKGPSLVLRNQGSGMFHNIIIEALRIEGSENGDVAADLLTIGDPDMSGRIAGIMLSDVELIDPYRGYSALRIAAAPDAPAPYEITFRGMIGGGLAHGGGIRIDAGRSSSFQLSSMHTEGVNVSVGPGAGQLTFDGGGREGEWTWSVDASSRTGLTVLNRTQRRIP